MLAGAPEDICFMELEWTLVFHPVETAMGSAR
jgi:hypothetical protein